MSRRAKAVDLEVDGVHGCYLDDLVRLGYGETRGAVMTYLLQRALDDLLRCGVLAPKRAK